MRRPGYNGHHLRVLADPLCGDRGAEIYPGLVQCPDRHEPPDSVPATAGRHVSLLPQGGNSSVAAAIVAGTGGSGD